MAFYRCNYNLAITSMDQLFLVRQIYERTCRSTNNRGQCTSYSDTAYATSANMHTSACMCYGLIVEMASCVVCRQKLLANAEKRKNVITDLPFKGPSPMKLSVGLGDCYGTFQGKVPYIAVGL